jgi:hypothetical protein
METGLYRFNRFLRDRYLSISSAARYVEFVEILHPRSGVPKTTCLLSVHSDELQRQIPSIGAGNALNFSESLLKSDFLHDQTALPFVALLSRGSAKTI